MNKKRDRDQYFMEYISNYEMSSLSLSQTHAACGGGLPRAAAPAAVTTRHRSGSGGLKHNFLVTALRPPLGLTVAEGAGHAAEVGRSQAAVRGLNHLRTYACTNVTSVPDITTQYNVQAYSVPVCSGL